ncbi:MAG: hypothetical protein Q8O57_12240, partial [Kiritimatiellota bacterium]|nr:hypothetical protein [Kiritimatiellota bacterium]
LAVATTTSQTWNLQVAGDSYFGGGNMFVGSSTESITNAGFVMDNNDSFFADMLGVGNRLFDQTTTTIGNSLDIGREQILGSTNITLQGANDVYIRPTTDSATALAVKSAAGTNYFTVDTTSAIATSTFLGGLSVDTNTLVVNANEGRVGIGTVNPQYGLDVQNNVTSNIYARLGTTQTLQTADLAFGNGTRTWGLRINGNATGDFQLVDLTAGPTYLTVVGGASGGNVGIATTSPYAKLSVVGEVVATNFTATSTTATSTFQGGLSVANGAIAYDFTSGVTSIDNLMLGAMNFDTNAGQVSWIDMPVTSAATHGTIESYTAQLDGNPMFTVYGESDGSGGIRNRGVGIGTTTPQAYFSVAPPAGATNTASLMFQVASTTQPGVITSSLAVAMNGNVGISTTTPGGTYGEKLTVVGSEYVTGTLYAGALSVSGGSTFHSATTTDSFNAGRLAVATTTSPDFKFQVAGASFLTGTTTMGSALNPATLVVNTNEGRVGIGTASPGALLHVAGNIRLSGNLLDTNGNIIFAPEERAGAVNYLTVRSGETGVGTGIFATGAD